MVDVSKFGRAFGVALLLGAVAMPLSAMAAGTAAGMSQGTAATTQASPAMHQHVGKAARHNEVTAAQTALNKNGASLKVDGKMGPKTKAALTAFQTKQNLKASGHLDKETRAALKV
jgi:peptidoglycan hydrolase-like protein with peptidoglycan-binding domain